MGWAKSGVVQESGVMIWVVSGARFQDLTDWWQQQMTWHGQVQEAMNTLTVRGAALHGL